MHKKNNNNKNVKQRLSNDDTNLEQIIQAIVKFPI